MTLTAPRGRTLAPLAGPRVAIIAAGSPDSPAPKPMTEIGGRPLLWHTMMHFAANGLNQFAIALGRQGEQVKRYMLDYVSLGSNLSLHLLDGRVEREGGFEEDWDIDLIDTGADSTFGGRLLQLRKHLGRGAFLVTTGEGVSDIDIDNLLAYHRSHGRLATAVAVRPAARFGKLEMRGDQVVEFAEKPEHEQGWTSAELYVLEPGSFDYIKDGDCAEQALERLANDRQLMAYRHHSFWGSIETLRDRQVLEELWQAGKAPWRIWE